jgi:Nuclear transport factor 2 (NTF2) domain
MFSNFGNIRESKLQEYFAELNAGRFLAAAELFADQGCLKPPFEKSIQGRKAIAQYFENEAKGMRFCPEEGQILTQNSEQTHYRIQGKVETNWFTVNVSWLIQLNSMKEIMSVEVSLLGSLTDLLHLNTSGSPKL